MDAPRIAIRCPRCGRVIGESDGPQLYLGGGVARRLITLGCAGRVIGGRTVSCGGVVVWRPCERSAAHYDAQLSLNRR